MKTIFVSGKYRDVHEGKVMANILDAEDAMRDLLRDGWCVICPHSMYAPMDGEVDDDVFLRCGLELVERADSIFMMKNWTHSKGAIKEWELANRLGKEIIYETN